jgi:integrase
VSVRKRSWKTAKGVEKQAWIVDYVDQTGARHIKTFDRKKEADSFFARATVEIGEGVHTADAATVTIAKAGEQWLASCEQRGLERTTIDSYRQALVYHINPHLGRLKLSQLSAPLVRQFEDDLRAGNPASGEDEGKPRSAAMVRKVRAALSILLGDAMERGLVNRNAARELRARRKAGAERKSERRQKGKLKAGVDIPLAEEIRAIIQALENMPGRHRAVIVTAIFTGLRASELRGLRWSDIDFSKKEIRVHQRADRYNVIGRPKSEAGERTVPAPPMALNALRQWKLQCPKSELGLAFPTRSGSVVQHTDIVNRGLIPAQLKAGVVTTDGKAKYTGLHSLRHFFASWCINRKVDGGLGLPPKVVQERLGHSSIMMTMDVYGHLFPRGDDQEELAEAESRLWLA